MKTFRNPAFLTCLILGVLAGGSVRGASTIVSDLYDVTTSGTGFALGNGVNTGINPPATRLTGTASSNLRYLQTVTSKPASQYDINSNRLRVVKDTTGAIGRFTLSANGSTPFDFAPALGTASATPANPVVYEIKISMRNNASTAARFSFGLATAEGDVTTWDFGVQLYRASTSHDFYTIQKRIDTASSGVTDINAALGTTAASTWQTMIPFLIRVTDAGAESSAYNSRVQVSINNGGTWIYDTATDAALPNGWRLDGAGRYFIFDQAGNASGNVFYDSFSVDWISGPRTWTGGGANGNWNTSANWGGAVPGNGDRLIFNGTARQTNTNNISGLTVPWVVFNNGGFALHGNALTVNSAITNITGNNALNGGVTAGGALRIQSDSGTLTLGGGVASGAQNLTVSGAGNTTVSSAISGTGSLTKDGSGLLQLSGPGANTYSGGTTINAGTLALAKTAGVNAVPGNVTVGDGSGGAGADVLRLNAANQIPDSATVTISASGLFDLNGFSETVASVSSSSAGSQIALGAGTLTVNSASTSTFAGNISGTGNLVKQGSGTMTLSGANTYSGSTTINAGKLKVAAGGSIASSSNIGIANGATLDVSAVAFNVASGKTLSGLSSDGHARISGNLTLSSGAQFSAQVHGGGSLVGKLSIDGNITLNGNTVTVNNVANGGLRPGTYALITFTGTRSGSFNTTPIITGGGLAAGLAAQIRHTAGVVSLFVYDPSATNTVFKVMHYNIHYGKDPVTGAITTTATSNYILNQNVDVVGMNEVDRFRDRSNNRDLPAEFAQKTGYTVVFTNANVNLTGNRETGNAVLSKHPILFRERILLPRVGNSEQRALLKTVVDIEGKFINFWSTHLDFRADNTERLMCVTNFNEWVTNEIFPTIIAGDFNETPDKTTHTRMEKEWRDIWLEAGDGTLGRTSPCPPPLKTRIDYIWRVKGNTLTPTNAFVGYTLEKSDHYPVLTKFHLNITTNYSSGFYLRFDEGSGTNILDSVGGLKGTLGSGAPVWSTNSPSGLPGDSSLFFNGNKKLTITDKKQIIGTNGVNDNYTLQAWVKVAVDYAPAQRAILFQYDRKPGFSLSINTNRTLHTTTFKILDIPSTATLPNDGQWHHVAVVHTAGQNMQFYIDGVLSDTVTYTSGAGYRTSADITVGADSNGANPFTGYLSRVKFDNRKLGPARFDTATPPLQLMSLPVGDPFETWKALHGITDADADADGDGQSNYAEYIANTNPNDASSLLRIIEARAQTDGTFGLTWLSVGGTRYRIQSSDTMDGEFVDVEREESLERDANSIGAASTQSFSDALAPTNSVRFYRIKVVP